MHFALDSVGILICYDHHTLSHKTCRVRILPLIGIKNVFSGRDMLQLISLPLSVYEVLGEGDVGLLHQGKGEGRICNMVFNQED